MSQRVWISRAISLETSSDQCSKRVEGYNADRIVELPGHQIGDDRFEIGSLDFGFAVDAAKLTEAAGRMSFQSILKGTAKKCRRTVTNLD
jgi:hypothetical protein